MAEYSFDIACKLNQQDLANALDTTRKEITNRFDFKGSHIEIKLEKDGLYLESADEMKMKQLIDVLQSKLIRCDLNLKAFQFCKFESNVSGIVKCRANIQNGLNQEQCKKITKLIKESRLKVQTRVQQDTVRVTGKSKNDLQAVQQIIKQASFDFATLFENYR